MPCNVFIGLVFERKMRYLSGNDRVQVVAMQQAKLQRRHWQVCIASVAQKAVYEVFCFSRCDVSTLFYDMCQR